MSKPTDPLARRLARVRARLAEQDVEGLLISHLANVRYLTGFGGTAGLLALSSDRAIFATDGRYAEQAAEELPASGFELLVATDGALGALARRVGEGFGGERVGFEAPHLSYADWTRLQEEADGVEWIGISGVVEWVRAVKEEGELSLMRRACEVAAEALAGTLPLVRPGVSEAELAAELDHRMRGLGASGPAFETIVASGPRTALPHASTSERVLEEGDLVLFDFGARWRGYASDLTRTFVLGRPQPRQQEIYELVVAARRAVLEVLGAGVDAVDVDGAARKIFAEAGVEDSFPHSTGHGLGLEVHEGPRLSRKGEETLRAGMVVTVEPGLYFSGWGGIRIEDDLVVGERGAEPLVAFELDLLRSLPF